MQRLDRWPALDGLRALAVCAVILTHTWVSQFPGGWIGVDVFFVLSGFLITGVLLREHGETGTISLLGFYRRRVVRLLPALLVMLLIVVIAAYVFRPGLAAATLRTAIFTVVYSANWLAASHQPLGLLSHMWSLSVEEQFYLVWPVLLVVMLRWRGARIALIVTILCVVAVVIHRTLLAQLVDLHDPQLFWRTDTRVDSILVGCALCLASSLGWKGSERLWRIAAIVGAAYMGALLPTAYNTGRWNYTIGYTLLALAAAGVVGAAAVRTLAAVGACALVVAARQAGQDLVRRLPLASPNRNTASYGSRSGARARDFCAERADRGSLMARCGATGAAMALCLESDPTSGRLIRKTRCGFAS